MAIVFCVFRWFAFIGITKTVGSSLCSVTSRGNCIRHSLFFCDLTFFLDDLVLSTCTSSSAREIFAFVSSWVTVCSWIRSVTTSYLLGKRLFVIDTDWFGELRCRSLINIFSIWLVCLNLLKMFHICKVNSSRLTWCMCSQGSLRLRSRLGVRYWLVWIYLPIYGCLLIPRWPFHILSAFCRPLLICGWWRRCWCLWILVYFSLQQILLLFLNACCHLLLTSLLHSCFACQLLSLGSILNIICRSAWSLVLAYIGNSIYLIGSLVIGHILIFRLGVSVLSFLNIGRLLLWRLLLGALVVLSLRIILSDPTTDPTVRSRRLLELFVG